jgi:hypothetical protein
MEKQMGKVGRVRAFLRICNASVRFRRKKERFFMKKSKKLQKNVLTL